MEKEIENNIYHVEVCLIDCLGCNEIQELAVYAAARVCNECGEALFVNFDLK